MELQVKESECRQYQEQIERQSAQLVQLEERWAKQTKDMSQQQKNVRDELEQVSYLKGGIFT